ncbi:MAG TPA: lysylphosphatidylglycerol synthase domain-containing protein [Solirubrobacteraceae bacterium]|nr:lysylphosphatidylglycerol synthase domain-containing protein [Solirubrobacteraceae bacterium]
MSALASAPASRRDRLGTCLREGWDGGWLRWLHRHPTVLMTVATGVAGGGVAIVASDATWPAAARVWTRLAPGWLLVVLTGAALAIAAYVVAYRALLQVRGGPQLPTALVAQIVAVGFGPFLPAGGFAADRHALRALGDEPQAAKVTVSAIGWLELAVLSPAVAIAAAWALLTGAPARLSAGLVPWVWGVPLGFMLAVGAWRLVCRCGLDPAASGGRVGDAAASGWRNGLGSWLAGVGVLLGLRHQPRVALAALAGMAGYWACDLVSFDAALRVVGIHLDLRLAVVVYATGYALTRRSMPLGGAGITEILMAYALEWVGVALAPAVAAVVVYRIFNFLLPAVPALLVHQNVEPLLEAEDGEHAGDPLFLSAEDAIVEEAGEASV